MAALAIMFAGQARKYHRIDEVPWGKAPFDMGWNLSFEGLELGGDSGVFIDSLETRGYEMIGEIERRAILKGTYAGMFPDSRLVVHSRDGKAFLVEVYPKAERTWEGALAAYAAVKREITVDEGETVPHFSDENLNVRHVREGRRYMRRIHRQFRDGNAVYETVVPVAEGTVTLGLTPVIANPAGRWFWNRGRFQPRVLYRTTLPSDVVYSGLKP